MDIMDSDYVSTEVDALQNFDFPTVESVDIMAPEETSARDLDLGKVDFEMANWCAAIKRFESRHKDEKRVTEFLKTYSTPEQAKRDCLDANARAKKEYASALGNILRKIEPFMAVGDFAVKGAPESVGLAWMGVRLCMHAVEDDFATFGLFSGAAVDIIGILISCRVYGKMYGGITGIEAAEFKETHENIVEYIREIYYKILEFSFSMSKQMDKNKAFRRLQGFWKPAMAVFWPMIEGIRTYQSRMSQYAQEATNQLSVHYHKVGLKKQDALLQNLDSVKKLLDMDLETHKEREQAFQQLVNAFESERKDMKRKTPLDKEKENFNKNKERLDPSTISETLLQRSRNRRSQGTCEWVFVEDEYKKWRTIEGDSLLWISGEGGRGKSVLMASIIGNLQTELRDSPKASAQYFICAKGDNNTESAARIKHQLIFQLYQLFSDTDLPDLLKEANDIVNNYLGPGDPKIATSKGPASDSTAGFEEAYRSLGSLLDRDIYLVIDALDECIDRQRAHLLRTLKTTLTSPKFTDQHLKIILCSRPEDDIRDELSQTPSIRIEDHIKPDIEKAAREKLDGLPGLSPQERISACKAIVQSVEGIFRCVDPAIDYLKKPFKRPLQKVLDRLPKGLENSYQQALEQTDSQYLDLLKTALRWCILAKRNPTIAEIMDDFSCAYDQTEGDDENPYEHLDDPEMPEDTKYLIHDQIRKAGSNMFLEIQSHQMVKTRHTTVKDFFLPPPVLQEASRNDKIDIEVHPRSWKLSEKEGHLDLAITIFKHLNSPLFQRRYLQEDSEFLDTTEAIEKPGDLMGPEAGDQQISETRDCDTGDALGQPANALSNNNKPENSPPDGHTPFSTIEPSPSAEVNMEKSDTSLKDLPSNGPDEDFQIDQIQPKIDVTSGGATKYDTKERDDSQPGQADVSVDTVPATQEKPLNQTDEDGDNGIDSEKEYGRATSADTKLSTADGNDSQPGQSDIAVDTASATQKKPPEQIDEDDDDGTDSENDLAPRDEGDDSQEDKAIDRYEIECWPYHIQEAERLWTREERSTNPRWQELWDLVVKFLRGSPKAFRAWQKHLDLLPDAENNPMVWTSWDDVLSPLHVAAAYGLTGLCEVLIERGESAMTMTTSGLNALWYAVEHSTELLKLLMDHGGDPNACSKNMEPPFHKLFWSKPSVQKVRLMIDKNADCELQFQGIFDAIHLCTISGDVEILRLVLAKGVDINSTDENGETALHWLLRKNPLPIPMLEEFLERGAFVNVSDKEGQQPLYEVCNGGSADGCRLLLDHHAQIDHADIEGTTALQAAASCGHLDCVQILVEKGADLIKVDGHSRTAFFKACANGHVEIVKFLINAAYKKGHPELLWQTMDDGRTPFSKACEKGHAAVVGAFLEHTDTAINLDAIEGPLKRTALHWASKNGRMDVVTILLEKKANAAICDSNGKTPLNLSAKGWTNSKSARWEQLILALIEHDVETASSDGQLMINAAIHGSVRVIARLLDLEVDATQQDEHGWTPLQLARHYGHKDAVNILSKRGAVVRLRPSRWISELSPIKLFDEGVGLEHSGGTYHACQIISDHPVPAGIESFYFEVAIDPEVGKGPTCEFAVGFTTQRSHLDNSLPGLFGARTSSWGFHGDIGCLCTTSKNTKTFSEAFGQHATFGKGNTIGCGVVYTSDDGLEGSIFYTKDGEALGVAFESSIIGRLYPTIGMSEAVKCTANWGHERGTMPGNEGKPFQWQPANAGEWNIETVKASAKERIGREEREKGSQDERTGMEEEPKAVEGESGKGEGA